MARQSSLSDIRWSCLSLADEAQLVFPDGVCARLRAVDEEDAVAQVSTGVARWTTRLVSVVDDGESSPGPQVFVVVGQPRDRVLVLGGPTAYCLSSAGAILYQLSLWREPGFSEHWTTAFMRAKANLLFVYEAGVLCLTPQLTPLWHARKYFNDVVSAVGEDRLSMLRDHEQAWWLLLQDGRAVFGDEDGH